MDYIHVLKSENSSEWPVGFVTMPISGSHPPSGWSCRFRVGPEIFLVLTNSQVMLKPGDAKTLWEPVESNGYTWPSLPPTGTNLICLKETIVQGNQITITITHFNSLHILRATSGRKITAGYVNAKWWESRRHMGSNTLDSVLWKITAAMEENTSCPIK